MNVNMIMNIEQQDEDHEPGDRVLGAAWTHLPNSHLREPPRHLGRQVPIIVGYYHCQVLSLSGTVICRQVLSLLSSRPSGINHA